MQHTEASLYSTWQKMGQLHASQYRVIVRKILKTGWLDTEEAQEYIFGYPVFGLSRDIAADPAALLPVGTFQPWFRYKFELGSDWLLKFFSAADFSGAACRRPLQRVQGQRPWCVCPDRAEGVDRFAL